MEALDAKFMKAITELREDFNRRMEALDAKFTRIYEDLRVKLIALGRRYGIETEEILRRALKGILEEKFGVEVERWIKYDEEGILYGHPSIVEVDVVVRDGDVLLIELTAHAKKGDVAELKRKAKLYEKKTGKKPSELIIISPFMDKKALELARLLG